MLHVGKRLIGYCGGHFGRDSYENKSIEAVGTDWIVAREEFSGRVVFADFSEPGGWELSCLERFVEGATRVDCNGSEEAG